MSPPAEPPAGPLHPTTGRTSIQAHGRLVLPPWGPGRPPPTKAPRSPSHKTLPSARSPERGPGPRLRTAGCHLSPPGTGSAGGHSPSQEDTSPAPQGDAGANGTTPAPQPAGPPPLAPAVPRPTPTHPRGRPRPGALPHRARSLRRKVGVQHRCAGKRGATAHHCAAPSWTRRWGRRGPTRWLWSRTPCALRSRSLNLCSHGGRGGSCTHPSSLLVTRETLGECSPMTCLRGPSSFPRRQPPRAPTLPPVRGHGHLPHLSAPRDIPAAPAGACGTGVRVCSLSCHSLRPGRVRRARATEASGNCSSLPGVAGQMESLSPLPRAL